MKPARRILIVGGGFSGAALAVQLLRQARQPLEICLVEKREIPGKGVAYGTSCESHLLNVPAGKMSLYPDQPEHFLHWARRHSTALLLAGGELGPNDFLPRKLFGQYVVEELALAREEAGPGVLCWQERDEAIDLQQRPEGGALVLLRSGKVLPADVVVLALGNLPSRYPISKPLPVYDHFRYLHFPWEEGRLEEIPPEDDVLLVGAGLTSIDIALQLKGQGHRGLIHALSRRGLQPQNHEKVAPWPLFLDRENLPVRLLDLLQLFRREVRLAERGGSNWRAVVDSLRPVTQDLWLGLSPAEKRRFQRHLRPFWEVHRHRVAPAVGRRIEELERSRQLKRWAGRLTRLAEDKEGVEGEIRLLGSSTLLRLRVGWVINCTGPSSDFSKFDHPLLISLLANGLLYHDPLALGFSADRGGALIPYGSNQAADWIFTLGAPLKGVLWETTAVPELRVQAEQLALRILALTP